MDVPNPTAPTATGAEDRSQTFRPVEGGTEMASGEKLLVEAYSAIWIILFVFIFLSWRRQRQIDARIAGLEVALDAARKAEAPSKGAQ
jgi:CcmD family protein